MKTITIQIPEGHTIEDFDKATGIIKFKEIPKDIKERIKTVDDVLKDNGITKEQFNKQCEGLDEDEIAYRILKMLVKSLNEGWKPDWSNDDNQYKYFAWFYMGGSRGFRYNVYDAKHSHSAVGSRLAFKSSELAKYAGEQFTDVFKQFMTF